MRCPNGAAPADDVGDFGLVAIDFDRARAHVISRCLQVDELCFHVVLSKGKGGLLAASGINSYIVGLAKSEFPPAPAPPLPRCAARCSVRPAPSRPPASRSARRLDAFFRQQGRHHRRECLAPRRCALRLQVMIGLFQLRQFVVQRALACKSEVSGEFFCTAGRRRRRRPRCGRSWREWKQTATEV